MSIPNEPTGRVDEIKEKLRTIVGGINEAKAAREESNADVRAAVERAEQLGISRHALRMAMKYASWDVDQRRGFDVAYELVREAIGLPIQADLMTWLAEHEPPAEPAEKKEPEDA